MARILHTRQVLLVLLLCACVCAVPFVVAAQAADAATSTIPHTPSYTYDTLPNNDVIGDFVVGPGKVELTIEPGQSKTIELLITNRTGEPHEYSLEVEDITGSSDGSNAVTLLGDDRGPYTLKDYITIPKDPIPIDHAKRVRVPITISIPKDAEPGGRYGSVLVTTVSKEGAPAGPGVAASSALIARIGTLFFVTVPGDIATGGRLKDFTTIPPGRAWFSSGPIHFSLLYENTGSIHLNPYGEIRITNMFGEEVGFQELEPWFALPQSLRFREVSWDREFLFGRYTATAHINRGYGDIIDTMEVHFWVIPWKLALVVFAGLFVLFYLIRTFFKRFEFRRKG